ncbi:sensor domain-containing diguanylate cyclase [Amphibiibacter pelophylacis]|uniref:Diguanylate cyclase n=1 Tax=Amphibiibacter pelophylacis TaxID=1799477 RepID=A0ACC6P5T0_9BURK
MMRILAALLLTLLLAPAWSMSSTPAQSGPPQAIIVTPRMADVPVLPHAQLLEDPQHTLEVPQLRSQPHPWQPLHEERLSLGYTPSAWWLRFELVNPDPAPVRLVADLGSAVQDDAQWYVVDAVRGTSTVQVTGDRRPFAERDLPLRQISQRITVPSRSTVEVYVRLDSYDGLMDVVDISLSDSITYLEQATRTTAGLSLFLGLLMGATIYTLMLARVEVVYAWLGVHLIFFMGWYAGFHGFISQYLLPRHPDLSNNVLTTVTALAALTFIQFSLAYLRPALKGWTWAVRALQLLLLPLACVPVLALLGYYGPAWLIILGSAGPLLVGIMALALRVAWQGAGFARRFLVAFTAAQMSVLATALDALGLMPGWITPYFSMELGLGLGYYYLLYSVGQHLRELRTLRREAEVRDREHALQQDAQRRQMQLQSDNHILRQKSITDELTGVFNRRHFNDTCDRIQLDCMSHGRPMGLCMLDVDHFKHYNDHYGHQQGDNALRLIASALQQTLAAQQIDLFRLGGEEFGFFMDCGSGIEALELARTLGLRVRQLGHPHVASPLQRLTVSLGVAWWPSHEVVDLQRSTMYECADRALYAAKAQGRDTTVLYDGSIENETRPMSLLHPQA